MADSVVVSHNMEVAILRSNELTTLERAVVIESRGPSPAQSAVLLSMLGYLYVEAIRVEAAGSHDHRLVAELPMEVRDKLLVLFVLAGMLLEVHERLGVVSEGIRLSVIGEWHTRVEDERRVVVGGRITHGVHGVGMLGFLLLFAHEVEEVPVARGLLQIETLVASHC